MSSIILTSTTDLEQWFETDPTDLQQWFEIDPTPLYSFGRTPTPYNSETDKLAPVGMSGLQAIQREAENISDQGEPMSTCQLMSRNLECYSQAELEANTSINFDTGGDIDDFNLELDSHFSYFNSH